MQMSKFFDDLSESVASVPQGELLAVTGLAILIGWIGTMMVRRRVALGRLVSTASTLILGIVLVVVVLQLSHIDPRFAMAVGGSEQTVEGGETRISLSNDGHFWLEASINGEPAAFLVDTGATLTAISQETADRAGLKGRSGIGTIRLETANGPIAASLTEVEELSFGNINANNVDAVIAPNLGRTNVIGMNVLSRLASWRVEGDTMILVPEAGDRDNSLD